MEEWMIKQKTPSLSHSLTDIYKHLLPQNYSLHYAPASPQAPADILAYLKKKADDFKLHNLTFKIYPYIARGFIEITRDYSAFLKIKKPFLKFMAYSCKEECRRLGLSEEEIKLLHNGFIPENINIHLKIPFDFGGQAVFENMSLMRTHPHHLFLHRLIECQFELGLLKKEKQLFIPCFEGHIYYG